MAITTKIVFFVIFSGFGLFINGALGRRSGIFKANATNQTVAFAHDLSSDVGTCQSRIKIFGYPCEDHTVTTKDGYILSLQRIPGGRPGSASSGNKIPILLQHGLFMVGYRYWDGLTWFVNSPNESLGYVLADEGYDVWIANTRGTIYSLAHTSLSSNDPAYWDWSWDELVGYDLPAFVGYVYEKTGKQKIHYVGHSLGTLIALGSFSEQNLISMVRSAALLSPIAYLDQLPSPFMQGAARLYLGEELYQLGITRFNPNGEEAQKLLARLCQLSGINCYDLMTAITGQNCCLNSSTVQIFLDHEPQSSSTKNLIHLTQNSDLSVNQTVSKSAVVRTGTVTKYDYGDGGKNMEHYGQSTPPAYNIAGIPADFPLFLSYGGADILSDVADVRHLLGVLAGHDAKAQYIGEYAHADFIFAVNAKQKVYDPMVAFFKQHES
ncbi:Triacylglycerol lipase 2 [Apostasia shenzhenica]|uniref:Lipase n=1 Tax=Apostasia shenzhenica TaxID=1088818 RepID=A0A2I0AQX7_9ASPA|nr:Triacylglycerol lipase 2 [Apostasia shenzhenica]